LSKAVGDAGLEPGQVLYVGSQPEEEIAPAKKRGFRTALFLGDKASADVSPDHLKQDRTRPDALLTRLEQVLDVAPR
jgi:FMN phosphatase YigB (HAD superfamily)